MDNSDIFVILDIFIFSSSFNDFCSEICFSFFNFSNSSFKFFISCSFNLYFSFNFLYFIYIFSLLVKSISILLSFELDLSSKSFSEKFSLLLFCSKLLFILFSFISLLLSLFSLDDSFCFLLLLVLPNIKGLIASIKLTLLLVFFSIDNFLFKVLFSDLNCLIKLSLSSSSISSWFSSSIGFIILSSIFISFCSIFIPFIKSKFNTSFISILSSWFFLSNFLIKSLQKLSLIRDKSTSEFNIASLTLLSKFIKLVSVLLLTKGHLNLVSISNNNIPHFQESNFEFEFGKIWPFFKLFISSGE